MATISIDQVIADTNLLQAWYKVRANQGCAGIDGETIKEFESHLMPGLNLLRDEVIYDTYRPRPLWRIEVPKKSGTGLRPLSIPTVRDRILQTAVALVLTPIFEAEFEECSYAYRPGRSVDMAVARVERLRDQGFTWVVDADISSFFDEVDHDLLMDAVRELIPDPMIRKLINRWLRADVKEGDRYFRLDKGVPQGSPISPMLANLYLDRLDEAILAEQLRIVRFADDFLILCRDRKQAEKALDFTAEVLETLRLELNRQKTEVKDFNRGFRFLGVEFVRTLILKAKHPEIKPEPIDTRALEIIPRQKEKSCPAPPQPETTMAMALSEAGLKPDDFPDQVEQVMENPPPDPEGPVKKVVDHDPRLRTLYILEHGYVLGKESERFTVSRERKVVQRVPAIKVDQIMIFGNAQITTQAMQI